MQAGERERRLNDEGQRRMEEGDCGSAIPLFNSALQNGYSGVDAARATGLRGLCFEEMGRLDDGQLG